MIIIYVKGESDEKKKNRVRTYSNLREERLKVKLRIWECKNRKRTFQHE